jgi:hypothetical protein
MATVPLVSLADAKTHLKIPPADTRDDADLTLKIAQASAVVVGLLKAQADPSWDAVTVPEPVQSAVLLHVGHLFANRGDAAAGAGDAEHWEAIDRVLWPYRDPALA